MTLMELFNWINAFVLWTVPALIASFFIVPVTFGLLMYLRRRCLD